MAKILKRTVDALQPESDRDVFAWDSELRARPTKSESPDCPN